MSGREDSPFDFISTSHRNAASAGLRRMAILQKWCFRPGECSDTIDFPAIFETVIRSG